jgi:group I intron endonuclease
MNHTLMSAKATLKGLSGIYCIQCLVTNMVYLGSSVDLERRIREHFRCSSNLLLRKAIAEYGKEYFVFSIVEICVLDTLLDREQYYVNLLFTLPENVRYNMCPKVGTCKVLTHSEGTKAKIGNFRKGSKHSEVTNASVRNSLKGANNPITGKLPANACPVILTNLTDNTQQEFSSKLALVFFDLVSLRKVLIKCLF